VILLLGQWNLFVMAAILRQYSAGAEASAPLAQVQCATGAGASAPLAPPGAVLRGGASPFLTLTDWNIPYRQ